MRAFGLVKMLLAAAAISAVVLAWRPTGQFNVLTNGLKPDSLVFYRTFTAPKEYGIG
jgi:hypothetical protein